MPQFVKVASVGDLAPGKCKTVQAAGRSIALCNVDGKLHAVDNTCLHRGGPLGEGMLNGQVLVCPWHGWGYDLTTGKCNVNPAAQVARYEVKVEGSDVQVAV